jgi:hypothetical protein
MSSRGHEKRSKVGAVPTITLLAMAGPLPLRITVPADVVPRR